MKFSKIIFYIISISFFIFSIVFSIILGLESATIIFVISCFLFLIFLHRKINVNPHVRLFKVSLIIFLVSFSSLIVLYPPKSWNTQLIRNLKKASLIEPENYAISELEKNFFKWIESKPYLENIYGLNYTPSIIPFQYENSFYIFRTINFSEIDWNSLDHLTRLLVINYYITEEVIEWTEDSEVYGTIEFKGKVDEVLKNSLDSNWTQKSKDDCDGIAVVTVSFLQRLGYKAYIGSGKAHWFTVVEPRFEDNFYTPLFLNTWRDIHVFYYFNQYEFKLGQPLIDTFKDVWFLDEDYPEIREIIRFLTNNLLLSLLISIIVSFIAVLFICWPREYSSDILKEKIHNIQKRKEKITSKKYIGKKYNPLYWFLRITYIQIGNPFNKLYLFYWIDVFWCSIFILLIIFRLNFIPLYWLNSYLLLTIFLLIYILESQISVKIIKFFKGKIKRK